MSHCLFREGGQHSAITDQHLTLSHAYHTFVLKQDHILTSALIYNVSFVGDFSVGTFTFKSTPLDGNRHLFSQMGGDFLAQKLHISLFTNI